MPANARQPNGQYKAMVDKAVAYLKKSQNEDGSWGKEPQNRGVTGIVVTGLIRTGVKPDDAPAAKGVEVHRDADEQEGRAHRRRRREGRAHQLHDQHQRHGAERGRTRATSTRP